MIAANHCYTVLRSLQYVSLWCLPPNKIERYPDTSLMSQFSGSDDGSDHQSHIRSDVSEDFNEDWLGLDNGPGDLEVKSQDAEGGDEGGVMILTDDDEDDEFAASQYLRVPNNSPETSDDDDDDDDDEMISSDSEYPSLDTTLM